MQETAKAPANPSPAVMKDSETREQRNRPRVLDCLFLLAVVMVSALTYLHGLGFYLDDWALQGSPYVRLDHGIAAKFERLVMIDPDVRIRPLQAAYLASAIQEFGSNPLPYHVVGTLCLGLTVIMLYVVLVELKQGHRLALALSLVYGLLPHYSTDRFWIASHQAVFCMFFRVGWDLRDVEIDPPRFPARDLVGSFFNHCICVQSAFV